MTLTHLRRRARFYAESASAVIFALTTGLLLWHPDWIEALTGADPDHGSAAAEWMLVIASGTATLLLSQFARREWARPLRGRGETPPAVRG